MGFLTVMLGLMALRQSITLLTERVSWAILYAGHTTELPGLIVSVMAFLAVFFMERIITERKKAKQELHERKNENTKLAAIAEERRELQDWIDTFDTFVGKFDPNGVGIIFNETPIKAGGLTKDDVVGKCFYDTLWWSHSEIERARVVECFERARSGLSSRIETNFRSADGTPVPIIFNCQPVMDDGKVKYITAEGKTIIEEVKLRDALQQEKENLEKRVKERTSESVTVNEKLRKEITVRKQADEALLESEKFFSGTLNDMLTFVAVLEPDGKVVFVNNTPLDMSGITLSDVKGRMFYDALWWRYSGKAKQQIKNDIEICATGETLFHEIEIQTVDGGLIWIEYSMHPIYDEDGKIQYLVPEGRDITERKQAENRIQHLQSVLKAIRNVNQLIVHERNQQKLLQEACEILNQTRNYKLIWIGLVQEGTMDVLPAAQAGFEKGYLKSIKITWDDSDAGKGPTGIAIKSRKPFVMHDIASNPRYKLWREEAIKRGYTSSAGVPIVYENRVFGVLNVYTAIFDIFNEEEIDLLVEVSQDIAFALYNIEVEEKHKLAENALHEAHEELEARVEERTKELSQANSQLKEMDRLKSEFLATTSHELRTPLNSIIGFTGIILKGIPGEINEEQKKQLSMVYGSARHLLSLINDILDLSQIESGKIELSVERFKIEDVIAEATHTLSPMISQKGLGLITEISDGIPEVFSDRKKVLQIFLNLVINSIKFTNEGEVKIECETDIDNLKVSVSDTGIGIKRENMDYLFESFRQIDSSAQRRYQGAGLGLYLCKKLVTLLGGEIWAESEYGKGSRFTFCIPLGLGERGAA